MARPRSSSRVGRPARRRPTTSLPPALSGGGTEREVPASGASQAVRVLGIDPGSRRTGWGLVERVGHGQRGIAAGVIRVSDKRPLQERLLEIHRQLSAVLSEHRPHAVAMEDIFTARYPRAALQLGHARGVAMLAVAQVGLEVVPYAPALVKKTVVGRGRADKRQVAMLVSAMLGLAEVPSEDAADALAVALTHVSAMRALVAGR